MFDSFKDSQKISSALSIRLGFSATTRKWVGDSSIGDSIQTAPLGFSLFSRVHRSSLSVPSISIIIGKELRILLRFKVMLASNPYESIPLGYDSDIDWASNSFGFD